MRTWYRSRNTSGFPLYWRSSSCLRSARLSSGSPICWLFTGLPLRATASTMSITHADSCWISSCNCGQGHCQQKKRSSPVMLLCCWTHQVRCLWLLRRYRECYMPLKWLCRRIFWLFDSVHILVFTQAWLRFDWRLNFAPHFNLLPKNDSAYLAANVINCLGWKVKRTYVQRTLFYVLLIKFGHLSKFIMLGCFYTHPVTLQMQRIDYDYLLSLSIPPPCRSVTNDFPPAKRARQLFRWVPLLGLVALSRCIFRLASYIETGWKIAAFIVKIK